jgi:6-phosphogluconolactonase
VYVNLDRGERFALVASGLGGAASAYALGEDGVSSEATSVLAFPGEPSIQAADLHVHPSGRFLYASNRGHDSIAAFAIERGGRLRAVGHTATGRGPRGFALTLDGRVMLVANQRSGDVRAYRVDPDTGHVTATGARTAVPCPVCVVVHHP